MDKCLRSKKRGGLGASGGAVPQKWQCDFGSFPPARASVNSPPAASRWGVGRHALRE
jgi:hypothetical protein